MAVSKVVLGDETLIDLTGDSVSSENLLQGETAHGANGEEVIGGVVVTPMYTGTKAAIEEAIALGQIPEDAVVNITDDEEASSFQTQINEINSSLNELNIYHSVDIGTNCKATRIGNLVHIYSTGGWSLLDSLPIGYRPIEAFYFVVTYQSHVAGFNYVNPDGEVETRTKEQIFSTTFFTNDPMPQ